jgi:hypothetical protein
MQRGKGRAGPGNVGAECSGAIVRVRGIAVRGLSSWSRTRSTSPPRWRTSPCLEAMARPDAIPVLLNKSPSPPKHTYPSLAPCLAAY